jgi:release factor glutamine methyltransferase
VTRLLVAAGCVAADEEATELVAAAPDDAALDAMVARRASGEPLAWITGTATFCGIDVAVAPGVYVPRWQSETLARRAADLLPDYGTAVDLCTGSGALARVLVERHPTATVLATETDDRAVACARDNGVDVRRGHLYEPLPVEVAGTVDVVVGVVPYVPADALHLLPRDVLAFEPLAALDGGADGLDLVRAAIGGSGRWLRSGGWLLLEVGADQIAMAQDLLADAGFGEISVLTDGDDDPRAVAGRLDG